jgi:RNA recognition motif-containing protein
MSTITVTTTTQHLLPPNQTLYITNLNDKIRKADLRASLYTLFSTYGVVLDVVALKTMRGRGQAHVAFRDIASATGSMRALQGFEVLGKAMVRCGFFFFLCCSSCGAGSGRGEEVGLC